MHCGPRAESTIPSFLLVISVSTFGAPQASAASAPPCSENPDNTPLPDLEMPQPHATLDPNEFQVPQRKAVGGHPPSELATPR